MPSKTPIIPRSPALEAGSAVNTPAISPPQFSSTGNTIGAPLRNGTKMLLWASSPHAPDSNGGFVGVVNTDFNSHGRVVSVPPHREQDATSFAPQIFTVFSPNSLEPFPNFMPHPIQENEDEDDDSVDEFGYDPKGEFLAPSKHSMAAAAAASSAATPQSPEPPVLASFSSPSYISNSSSYHRGQSITSSSAPLFYNQALLLYDQDGNVWNNKTGGVTGYLGPRRRGIKGEMHLSFHLEKRYENVSIPTINGKDNFPFLNDHFQYTTDIQSKTDQNPELESIPISSETPAPDSVFDLHLDTGVTPTPASTTSHPQNGSVEKPSSDIATKTDVRDLYLHGEDVALSPHPVIVSPRQPRGSISASKPEIPSYSIIDTSNMIESDLPVSPESTIDNVDGGSKYPLQASCTSTTESHGNGTVSQTQTPVKAATKSAKFAKPAKPEQISVISSHRKLAGDDIYDNAIRFGDTISIDVVTSHRRRESYSKRLTIHKPSKYSIKNIAGKLFSFRRGKRDNMAEGADIQDCVEYLDDDDHDHDHDHDHEHYHDHDHSDDHLSDYCDREHGAISNSPDQEKSTPSDTSKEADKTTTSENPELSPAETQVQTTIPTEEHGLKIADMPTSQSLSLSPLPRASTSTSVSSSGRSASRSVSQLSKSPSEMDDMNETNALNTVDDNTSLAPVQTERQDSYEAKNSFEFIPRDSPASASFDNISNGQLPSSSSSSTSKKQDKQKLTKAEKVEIKAREKQARELAAQQKAAEKAEAKALKQLEKQKKKNSQSDEASGSLEKRDKKDIGGYVVCDGAGLPITFTMCPVVSIATQGNYIIYKVAVPVANAANTNSNTNIAHASSGSDIKAPSLIYKEVKIPKPTPPVSATTSSLPVSTTPAANSSVPSSTAIQTPGTLKSASTAKPRPPSTPRVVSPSPKKDLISMHHVDTLVLHRPKNSDELNEARRAKMIVVIKTLVYTFLTIRSITVLLNDFAHKNPVDIVLILHILAAFVSSHLLLRLPFSLLGFVSSARVKLPSTLLSSGLPISSPGPRFKKQSSVRTGSMSLTKSPLLTTTTAETDTSDVNNTSDLVNVEISMDGNQDPVYVPPVEVTAEEAIAMVTNPKFNAPIPYTFDILGPKTAYDFTPQQVEEVIVDMPDRFIESEAGDVEKAKIRWIDHKRWRKQNGVDDLLRTPYPNFSTVRQMCGHFLHKRGNKGNFIYVERPGILNMKGLRKLGLEEDDLQRHFTHSAEFMWTVIDRRIDAKSISIIDLEGLGFMNSTSNMPFVKRISKILQSHYPVRSHKIVIVNVPSWFNGLWKLIKPLLHERTIQKTIICGGAEDMRQQLLTVIDEDCLPVRYGGSCNCDDDCTINSDMEKTYRALVEHINANNQ